jgi:ATP-binding cassette subfamily G (WHITE) protein 2 (PDR)
MPRFWTFMYRISPLTYQINSMFSAAVAGTELECAETELLRLPTQIGQTGREYLQPYIVMAGGHLVNPESLEGCPFCPLRNTDNFLATLKIHEEDRWWQLGIQLGYIACNVVGMIRFYWSTRVWKRTKSMRGRAK